MNMICKCFEFMLCAGQSAVPPAEFVPWLKTVKTA